MNSLKSLELEIELLRYKMHMLIEENGGLGSTEVMTASQRLDEVLTKYHYIKINEEKRRQIV